MAAVSRAAGQWLSVELRTGCQSRRAGFGDKLKSKELANLCSDTIDEVTDSAEEGLDRIGSDALCFAFLRISGLRL